MKNRQFDTEKLAASIKVLVKAAGLRNSEVCKDVRMSPSCYYRTLKGCLLYTSPSPRDAHESRMPSSA